MRAKDCATQDRACARATASLGAKATPCPKPSKLVYVLRGHWRRDFSLNLSPSHVEVQVAHMWKLAVLIIAMAFPPTVICLPFSSLPADNCVMFWKQA